jgi:prepilin-type N-terminal cleavage/methylation domain-containing protein
MNRRGLTLIEVMISVALMAVIAFVIVFVFRVVLMNWDSAEARADLNINITRGLEETVRDIRGAEAIIVLNSEEIRFSQNSATHYIYYFYNPNDFYPSNFDQDLYQLRKTQISGDIDGNFIYGDGKVINTELLPPPDSSLSFNNNIVTIDLHTKRENEFIRYKTSLKVRNL